MLAVARRRVDCLAIVVALLIGVTAPGVVPPAAAQSPTPAQLKRENDALRQRIDQLEAELDRANDTIDALRQQIDTLTQQVNALRRDVRDANENAGPSGPDDADQSGDAESQEPRFAELPDDQPLAAPKAMLRYMQRSYSETLDELPTDEHDDNAMRRYVNDVQRWSRIVRRDLRGEVQWVIEPLDVVERTPRSAEFTYRVLDPETLKPYSDRAWTLTLPRGSAARRFAEYPDHPLWLVRGRVLATPEVNPDRPDPGFFDIPPFIGPFAEFEFTLRIEAFLRVARPQVEAGDADDETDDGRDDAGAVDAHADNEA
jgi:type II secretory pathway pseudopilin PulG